MQLLSLTKKLAGITLGLLLTTAVQAQTIDSTEQKPVLNNELPGAPVPAKIPQPSTTPPQTRPAPAPTPKPTDTPPEAPGGYSEVIKNNKADMAAKAIEEPQTFVDHLFVGSTGGLGFGSDSYSGSYFNVSLSPFVGYRILPRWAVGPGVTYEYTGTNGYRLSTYGAKLFTQITIYRGLLAHLEHEALSAANLEYDNTNQRIIQTRRNITSTLAGGGYRQMNGNFGMDFYVLFNLNTGAYQYQSNPVIRVGFVYNLTSRR